MKNGLRLRKIRIVGRSSGDSHAYTTRSRPLSNQKIRDAYVGTNKSELLDPITPDHLRIQSGKCGVVRRTAARRPNVRKADALRFFSRLSLSPLLTRWELFREVPSQARVARLRAAGCGPLSTIATSGTRQTGRTAAEQQRGQRQHHHQHPLCSWLSTRCTAVRAEEITAQIGAKLQELYHH